MTVTPGTVAYVTTGGKSSYIFVKFLRLVTFKEQNSAYFSSVYLIYLLFDWYLPFQTLMQLGQTASIFKLDQQ